MVYGRFDSNIRFENESDSRFDSRFDSNEKNDSQVPRPNATKSGWEWVQALRATLISSVGIGLKELGEGGSDVKMSEILPRD